MASHQPPNSTRRMVAAAIAGATVSIVITLLATGYIRQRDLAREAEELRTRAETAELRARDEANRTRRAREQAAELISFFVENLRSELGPIGRTDILESVARQAEEYFENLPPDAIGETTHVHHARMLLMRAQAHYEQGALPESEAAFRATLALLEPLAQTGGEQARDPRAAELLAIVHNEFSLTLSQAGKTAAARAQNERALELYRSLAAGDPENPEWLHGISATQLGVAETLRRSGDRAAALPFYDLAIENASESLTSDADNVHRLATLMHAHTNKGYCLTRDDRFDEAETECNAASEIAERLIELEPGRKKWKKEYATLVNNFGSMLDDQGQTERARELVEKARDLRKELISFDPNNGNWRYDLANSEYNLAMNHLERGAIDPAWASTQQYLSHTSAMLRSEPANEGWHEDFARYIERLTERFSESGADTEAAKIFEATERLYRDLAEVEPDQERHRMRRADALYGAGDSRKRSGDFDSSLAHHRAAMQERLRLWHEDPENLDRRYELASAIGNFAQALQALDRFREALAHFQFAYATYLELPGGHRNRDHYLKLDEKNIRHMRAKLGLVEAPPAIIQPGSIWHYWDSGESPAPGWQEVRFDADAWSSGPGQLGYGDGDEQTVIGFGDDPDSKFPTAYFRREFEIDDPDDARTLHINLIRDDGAIIYLNGIEVARDMMPEGEVQFHTFATGFTPNNVENDPVWFDLPAAARLRRGKNVVAAEVHQNEPASSDLGFDLALFKNAPRTDPLEGMDRQALEHLLASPAALAP